MNLKEEWFKKKIKVEILRKMSKMRKLIRSNLSQRTMMLTLPRAMRQFKLKQKQRLSKTLKAAPKMKKVSL